MIDDWADLLLVVIIVLLVLCAVAITASFVYLVMTGGSCAPV